jgi:hypothetical protein
MKYSGQDILVGDVVTHAFEKGEWRVQGFDGVMVLLTGPRGRFSALPNLLVFVRRAAPPDSKPRRARKRRVVQTNGSTPSVGLNLGAHLGVARVDDEEDS